MEGKRVGATCIAASTTKLAGICICDCCLHRYCIYNISFTLIKYTHTFTDVSYPALATVLGFAAFNSVAILSFILINHGDRDLHLMHAFSSLREQREVNAKHGMAPAAMRS